MTTKNPIVRLLQSVTDVVNSYISKERAVPSGKIWMFIQHQLDAEAAADGEDISRSGYVLDIYIDSNSTFAIVSKYGKLYKVPVTVGANNEITIGEYEEVIMDFTPVTSREFTIKRQVDGKVRWFAMPACTAVLNRSGEIDSMALFDSFVEHAERTNDYPELDFFHLGESLLLGKADWVARDGVSYCASGLFHDTPIARAAIKSLEENKDFWGLSIAYFPTREPEMLRSKEGVEIPVFNDGINRFISLLPESTAASILTNISTQEEVNRMNKKVEEALRLLTGDDEALFNELAEKVDSVNRSAEGMISRNKPASTPSAPAVPAPAAVTPVTPKAPASQDIKAIIAHPDFKARVSEIVEELKAADPDDDQEEEGEETPEGEEKAEEARANSNEAVMAAIKELQKQVVELSKSREASITEVLNDLPAKVTRKEVYRPRATIMPTALDRSQRVVNMAEIANQTLEAMGEN